MENIVKDILRKENIAHNMIKKSTSGFTNQVYFIDDELVLKMTNDEQTKKSLSKETEIYQNLHIPGIPKYIANGNIGEYRYLIISKLKGTSLYSIWHKLSKSERKNCVKQIAEILKKFNKQDYSFLNDEYKEFNWKNYITAELTKKISALTEMGYKVDMIKDFVNNDLDDLFNNNSYGLVYNDAHFDNFIYDNGKLNLIDFDRVRVCPLDYEMLIFKTMCDNPLKFASEEDEDKINEEDYIDIYSQFKSQYPEMFEDKNVEERISIYQFNYLISQAIKCKNDEWIKELISNFESKKEAQI